MNRKAVQRLWREEGLRVPTKRRKRQRLGVSSYPADRLAAEHPNHVWALDYQFDQTTDGRILKLLNVVDEHTREALTITVDRRINADATVAVLDRLIAERGTPPQFIRCDNGPELTANALRDWCRFNQARTSYSSRARPGRTRTWRASAAGCATSCSPSRLAACWRPGCWSRTGGSSTTHPPTPQRPRLPDPDRLRQDLDHHPSRTLITDGPTTGARSPGAAAVVDRSRTSAPCFSPQPSRWWTLGRGGNLDNCSDDWEYRQLRGIFHA